MKKYKSQKIDTYVSKEDAERLKKIADKYKFGSTYKVLQHLISCFLKVADPPKEKDKDPVPYEIEEMFSLDSRATTLEMSKGEHAELHLKKRIDKRKIKTPDDL